MRIGTQYAIIETAPRVDGQKSETGAHSLIYKIIAHRAAKVDTLSSSFQEVALYTHRWAS